MGAHLRRDCFHASLATRSPDLMGGSVTLYDATAAKHEARTPDRHTPPLPSNVGRSGAGFGPAAQFTALTRQVIGADLATVQFRRRPGKPHLFPRMHPSKAPCYIAAMDRPVPTQDPVLPRLKAALQQAYGSQLDRVLLFGSRARGEARPDSDYDIAVFLKELPDVWKERFRLADLRVDFLDEAGVFVDAKPYPTTAYHDRTPLMHEIRRDGLAL